MASLTPSNYTTIQLLPEEQRFNGENLIPFKESLLPIGRLKGLNLYWEGRVVNPNGTPHNTPAPYETTTETSTTSKTTAAAPATVLPSTPSASTAINDPRPNVLEFELRESVAYLTLWQNIKNPDGLGIPRGLTSKELWTYIQTEFIQATTIARQRKEDNLRACRYVEGMKIGGEGGYAEKMRLLLKDANDCGASISKEQFTTIFLDSFPRTPTWVVITGSLMGEKNFNAIVSRLDEYYMHLGGNVNTVSGDRVTALQAEVAELKAALALSTRARGPVNPDLTCTNENCKGKGHTIENCWKLGGGKQGQYPKWWKGKRDAPVLNAPAANQATTNIVSGTHYALTAVAHAAINSSSKDTTRTFADTGASAHFFRDRSMFKTYEQKQGSVGSSSKEGVNFEIIGTGDVEIRVVHNNTSHILTFRNALHAPDIASNLISIGLLDELKWTMLIGGGRMVFRNPRGTEVFIGKLVGGLYLVEGSFTTVAPTALAAKSLNVPGDSKLWHRRFAHAGAGRISEASNLVDGLVITSRERDTCEDCILANHRRRPFDGDKGDEINPLERIYVDLFGPTRVKSVGGASYVMVLVDGGTSKKDGYFLENRTAETTLDRLDAYRIQSEKQTGYLLKIVRTDNAAEFTSQLWATYFKEHGIIHEFTAAYSSASNGVAERAIGVLIGNVRVMLLEARLGAEWWAEACAAGIYVENLLPSSRHPKQIPLIQWSNHRCDVSHLRVWGSTCYVHIPKERGESKLAPRSIKCQLVGYDAPGIYRCKVWETNEVLRSRDVVFDEGIGHWTSDPEGEREVDTDFFTSSESNNNSAHNNQQTTPQAIDVEPGRSEEHIAPTNSAKIPTAPHTPHSSTHSNPVPPPAPRRPRVKYTPTEPVRRSTRVRNLTQAMRESQEFMEDERRAERDGEDWAGNWNANENTILPEFKEEESEPTIALIAQDEPLAPEPDNKWVPTTYAEAITRPDLWGAAIDKEIGRLDEKKAFTPVVREEWMKLIGTRFVFDVVTNEDGKVVKRRVQLVAQGHTQKQGIHYYDSYSLTVRYESVRFVIAIAAVEETFASQIKRGELVVTCSTELKAGSVISDKRK